MIYHIVVRDINDEKLFVNLTREKILANFVCPFINREVTLHQGEIFNMVQANGMRVFGSDQAVTVDWPVNTQDYLTDGGEENAEGELENSSNIERLMANEAIQEAVVKAFD